ncbi:glycosyltransferase family 4 protein [Asaia sp. VD9]|uniref:glycosyltransferase family 4 protein n=1 Tax=Asaia sp. VD9 TaxID=3081235 RepID=UPI00301B66D8
MGKIVFLNPFSPDATYGGVKVTYQHAEILAKSGYEVAVYQPAGRPSWIDISDRLNVCADFEAEPDDVLVFPEVLHEFMLEIAQAPFPGKKVLFCQNPFYLYSYNFSGRDLSDMGFSHFIVPGRETAQSLSSVLGVPKVHVIPNSVDTNLFYPRQKHLCIATNPRKWPGEGGNSPLAPLLMSMLRLKYPETADVPWLMLENMTQRQVAEAMGGAAIFLALSRQEALPLTPLEAMASRCALVGFHGTGGKDYATHRNGYWFSPEECEEIVDCLATLIYDMKHHSPRIDRMLHEAEKTASQYSVSATYQAVLQVYGEICAHFGPRM